MSIIIYWIKHLEVDLLDVYDCNAMIFYTFNCMLIRFMDHLLNNFFGDIQ